MVNAKILRDLLSCIDESTAFLLKAVYPEITGEIIHFIVVFGDDRNMDGSFLTAACCRDGCRSLF